MMASRFTFRRESWRTKNFFPDGATVNCTCG
jgi:hypothetical protein